MMFSTTIRDTLQVELQRIVGSEVHVIPYQDSTDELDRLTVMYKQNTLSRLPEAPAGQLRVDATLTFIHPGFDARVAEPELDQWVPNTLADLHGSWLGWTLATKRLFQQHHLCYDVDAFFLTNIRNTTKEA